MIPRFAGRLLGTSAVFLLSSSPAAAALQHGVVVGVHEDVHVPAGTRASEPAFHAADLAQGERLLIEVEGRVVDGEREESGGDRQPDGAAGGFAGGIPPGAFVGVFAGGPPFLIGRGRLLWTAPAAGRLAFAVAGAESGTLTGGYDVRVTPLGRRGDPRQRRFPPPRATFVARREGGPLLELSLEDRSGLGLDRKTLRVFLDTRDGERVVLTPWFQVDSSLHGDGASAADSIGARLQALPRDVPVPAGLHRATATVADVLGNESPPATVYLDRP